MNSTRPWLSRIPLVGCVPRTNGARLRLRCLSAPPARRFGEGGRLLASAGGDNDEPRPSSSSSSSSSSFFVDSSGQRIKSNAVATARPAAASVPLSLDPRISFTTTSVALKASYPQVFWEPSDFLSLDIPWEKDRWMAACSVMFQSVITRPSMQIRFLERLLDEKHKLDQEQVEYFKASVTKALDVCRHPDGNWALNPKIFILLNKAAYRFQDPELAEFCIKRHLELSRQGILQPPPNRTEFSRTIALWYKLGAAQHALRILSLIEEWWLPLYRTRYHHALIPTEQAYTMCITALCKAGNLVAANAFLQRARSNAIKDNFYPRSSLFNSLMHAYAEVGDIDSAEVVFKAMISDHKAGNLSCCPDVISFGTFMAGLNKAKASGKRADSAETNERFLHHLLRLYEDSGHDPKLEPTALIYSIVIHAWTTNSTHENAPERAVDVLRLMIQNGTKPNVPCYNAVFRAWSRGCMNETRTPCYYAEQLERLWAEFSSGDNDFVPDRYSYMARIVAWERCYRKVHNEANAAKIELSNKYAASMALKALEEMNANWSSSSSLRKPLSGDEPNKTAFYNRVILTLARTGNVHEVERLLEQMKSGNDPELAPNESTLAYSLKAWQCSDSPDAGVKAEQWFVELTSPPYNVAPMMPCLNTMLSCWRKVSPESKEAAERVMFWFQKIRDGNDSVYRKYPFHLSSCTEILRCILRSPHHGDHQKTEWVNQVVKYLQDKGQRAKMSEQNPIHRFAIDIVDRLRLPPPSNTVP